MKKFMSLLLGAMLILSLIPMSVGATTESWNSFVYYQDGPEFSVEATEFVGAGAYKFIAAAYDANGKLVDMTSSDAAVKAGTLTAVASFEAPGEEADVSIASVKTMLWDSFSSATPIAKEGNFAVEPQIVNEDGTVSSLTNGFYEAIPVKVGGRGTFGAWDEATQSFTASMTDVREGEAEQKSYDNDLTTYAGFNSQASTDAEGNIISYIKRVDYVALAKASEVDRLVTVSYDSPEDTEVAPRQIGTEYYLTADIWASYQDIPSINAFWSGTAVNANNADYYYVGTNNSTARVVTDADAKLVYDVNTDAKYTYLIAKKNGNAQGGGGATRELQAYTKIQNKVIIDAFKASVEYNGLSYSQNGPEFTINAGEVISNTDLVLEATAYNSAGDVVAEVTEPIAVTEGTAADITATVNFEEDGEADPSIASVKTVLTDTYGTPVVEDSTFAVIPQTVDESGVYNNLTNGFYKPVIDGENVSISSSERHVWNGEGGKVGSWGEGSVGAYTLYDQNPSTHSGNTGGIGAGNHAQYIGTLSAAANIDRVVAYVSSTNAIDFYLAKNVDTSSAGSAAHLARFKGTETEDDGLYYLGNCHTYEGDVTDGVERLVLDADGGAYKYLVSDIKNGAVYMLYDFSPYQKVTATHVVSAPVVKVEYNGLAYSQNGPEFTVTANEFTANTNELIFKAIAYNAEGEEVATAEKNIAVSAEPSTLKATVNFEENGEADPSIASVKTVVTDIAGKIALEESTFTVIPQSVDENGVYNNLTNGFYKPVIDGENISVVGSTRFAWNATNGMLGSWGENIGGVYTMYDQNPATGTINSGGSGVRAQYVGTLNEAVNVDRVVAYTPSSNTVNFYLAKTVDTTSAGSAAHLARFKATETDDEGLFYLGSRNTVTGTVADGKARFVFDADGDAYKYLVSDIANAYLGVYEFSPYQKVTATNVVSEFEINVDYESLTFNQNGSVFGIEVAGLSANVEDLLFVATAYDAEGAVVAEKKATIEVANNVTASVDFEEAGEASADITKVTATIKDETGTQSLVYEQDFEINATNLMNGFYKPVIDNETVSISSSTRYAWNSAGSMLGSWGEGNVTDGFNLYDQNQATRSINGGGIGADNHAQYIGALSAAANIDRVVAYVSSSNAIDFYLAKAIDTNGGADHLARFAGAETTDADLLYLGNCNTFEGEVTDGVERLVFDTDGGIYQYLVSDIKNGAVYSLYEFSPYQKVVATYTYG